LAVLVFLPVAQRSVSLGQELVVFGAGMSLVGIQLVFGAGEQFFQGLGDMFVA